MDKQKIEKFEDMPVWNDAQNFAVLVYEVSKQFPNEEIYGLTSQIKRASVSVSANIAEGFGRSSKKDKAHFYIIAYGSLLETKNFVYLGRRLGYIDTNTETQLVAASIRLQKQINAIIKYLKNHD